MHLQTFSRAEAPRRVAGEASLFIFLPLLFTHNYQGAGRSLKDTLGSCCVGRRSPWFPAYSYSFLYSLAGFSWRRGDYSGYQVTTVESARTDLQETDEATQLRIGGKNGRRKREVGRARFGEGVVLPLCQAGGSHQTGLRFNPVLSRASF
jgi:hypothetical protein